ncbi:MAG: hypothetical protein V4510_08500 [bacterium]
MMRLAVVMAFLVLGATVTPQAGAVTQGDKLVLYMDRGDQANFACGPYNLIAEPAADSGSCGQGFAVAAAGQGGAPPHMFNGNGTDLILNATGQGTAFLRFSPLLHPGVFEVQVDVTHGQTLVATGKRLCDVADICDVALAGPGAAVPFLETSVAVRFPTIAAVFTPSMVFGGSDPSRIELAGTWGLPVVRANVTASALSLLPPSGDIEFHVGQGSQRCLAIALTALPSASCPVGPAPVFASKVLSDYWDAPRDLHVGGTADLVIGLASVGNATQPTAGSVDLRVTLYVSGRGIPGDATCAYSTLPASCAVHLSGPAGAMKWHDRMFLDIDADAHGQPVAIGGATTLLLHNLTWAPDGTAAAQVAPAASNGTPALPIPAAVAAVLLAGLGARARRSKAEEA